MEILTKLRINEIFYSIQGESTFAGEPCVFIRLAGCNLRCDWCDTEYAFSEGREMSFMEILDEVDKYNCRLIEVTGGEPLLQEGVLSLLKLLEDEGRIILLETGGHMDISNVDARVTCIMDIKCPSSGESEKMRWKNIDLLKPLDEVKFVIADRKDYNWAKKIIKKYSLAKRCTMLMSPVFGRISNQELAEWILDDRLNIRLQLQIHKYIWDPQKRGV